MKLFAWLYAVDIDDQSFEGALLGNSRELKETDDFDENWLFVYETSKAEDLQGVWAEIKKKGVSFVSLPNKQV